MAKLHDREALAAAERLAQRRTAERTTPAPTAAAPAVPEPVNGVDPEFPAARAHLVERGLLVTQDQIRLVLGILHVDDPDTVAALQIDRAHQVTVIRARRDLRRGADGLEVHEQLTREHKPIIQEDR